MKIRLAIFLIALSLTVSAKEATKDRSLNTAADVNYLSELEKEVIYEVNLFRSNPSAYAEKYIAPLAQYYDKKILHYPGDKSIMTQEGVSALRECVRSLKNATPVPILYPDKLLTKAANDHQNDQAKTGQTGHTGRDRSNLKQRIERYGKWQVRIAENIAYGNTSAQQIVIFLLIDDGVKNRGHRTNLLQTDFKKVGVACGSHPRYNTMCVMDFAGGMESK
ncbi:CAP domain-containing protein [Draconibacterium sp. IB214405]|uniref:CAP domain-containing protein n=1 Tax=Draconibacterium sp. IB214405 TaxID=3097352 RepID=UPI002A0C1B25|nr:CAP domain-containing protein [Draconibacterium sp. IB214405]MDX8340166.1 CAP domain-containing protein [Draconibacterium sp. IB214405]